MYIVYARSIDFASFWHFSFELWKYFDSVVFFCFSFYINIKAIYFVCFCSCRFSIRSDIVDLKMCLYDCDPKIDICLICTCFVLPLVFFIKIVHFLISNRLITNCHVHVCVYFFWKYDIQKLCWFSLTNCWLNI